MSRTIISLFKSRKKTERFGHVISKNGELTWKPKVSDKLERRRMSAVNFDIGVEFLMDALSRKLDRASSV